MTESYRTPAGSRVTISGPHRGIVDIDWSWLDEGACPEARPVVDVFQGEAMLTWACECCEPGAARLERVE